MKYDWKKENPKNRYIDDITEKEAKEIAYLATGKLKEFELIRVDASCNPNNIPHVKIYYKGYEPCIHEDVESYIGIFDNLDVYSEGYYKPYCQRELHEKLKEMQFD